MGMGMGMGMGMYMHMCMCMCRCTRPHSTNTYNSPTQPTTSHHTAPHHITPHHTTPHHITSPHTIPHHITSHHITSHHITPHTCLLCLPATATATVLPPPTPHTRPKETNNNNKRREKKQTNKKAQTYSNDKGLAPHSYHLSLCCLPVTSLKYPQTHTHTHTQQERKKKEEKQTNKQTNVKRKTYSNDNGFAPLPDSTLPSFPVCPCTRRRCLVLASLHSKSISDISASHSSLMHACVYMDKEQCRCGEEDEEFMIYCTAIVSLASLMRIRCDGVMRWWWDVMMWCDDEMMDGQRAKKNAGVVKRMKYDMYMSFYWISFE